VTITAMLLALPLADEPLVRAGHHDVGVTAHDVVVESLWVLSTRPEPDALFELAAPLPRTASVEGAQPEFGADGDVVALRISDGCTRCTLRVTTSWTEVKQRGALPAPVAVGGVHRLALDPDLAFRPASELGLVTELGFTAPPGFGLRARDRVDDLLAVRSPALGAYYVSADDVHEAGGVVGEVELRAEAQRRTAWAVGIVFVVLCSAAVLEYRRARRRADVERADAILEAEYAALEKK
jgi:hypothetical protein